jgi:Metallo-peptidase family M12B Reprolysin-like
MATQTRRLARLAGIGIPLVLAAGLLPGAQHSGGSAQAAQPAAAPSFITAAPRVSGRLADPGSGRHRLIGLRTDLIPVHPRGQRVSLALFKDASFTGVFEHKYTGPGFTSWSGQLTTGYGTFTIARSGSTYRMDISSLQGNYQVTQAAGHAYWVAQPKLTPKTDSDVLPPPASAARSLTTTPKRHLPGQRDSGAILDVLFAYNDQLVAQAGSYDAIAAYVGTIAAETNQALAQSGDRNQIRVVGLARTATNNAPQLQQDLTWLRKKHDGHYDDLIKARNRSHADVVHLLVSGTDPNWCGFGYEPLNRAGVDPSLGFSVTEYANCSINHSATHELGHNMGADHDRYPGVSHDSKLPYAAGFADPNNAVLSIMSYPNSTIDAGNIGICCTFLLYYSNPALSYNGETIGSATQFNAKAISKVEPGVAKYRLSQIYHGHVKIKGHHRVGSRLRVKPGHWTPGKTRFTYQWTLDGVGLRHAHRRHIRIKSKFYGHSLAVIVTGHSKTYTPVAAAASVKRIKKGRFHSVGPRLYGKHRVHSVLRVKPRVDKWHPHPSRVRVTWYRGHHKIQGAHGKHYRLTKKDRGHKVYAKIKGMRHGFKVEVRKTAQVFIHGR